MLAKTLGPALTIVRSWAPLGGPDCCFISVLVVIIVLGLFALFMRALMDWLKSWD